jgi:hypothetical protein
MGEWIIDPRILDLGKASPLLSIATTAGGRIAELYKSHFVSGAELPTQSEAEADGTSC